jgi:hypothetical protein
VGPASQIDPHAATPGGKPRARSLGIPFGGQPGRWNAITDVPGVEIGYATLIQGVTAIHPRGPAGAAGPVTAVGIVHAAIVAWTVRHHPLAADAWKPSRTPWPPTRTWRAGTVIAARRCPALPRERVAGLFAARRQARGGS